MALIDIERIIHSTKTAIACLIGFFIANIFGYGNSPWILISIIVVMCAQLYVGSVLQRAYLRFLGTAVGCLIATIVLKLYGINNLSLAITLGLTSFLFSYIATSQESLSYAGTLGAVTTIIILLNTNPTVLLALERFLEISVGILIATLVSQFILPIHARSHLRRAQAATLKQLHDYYVATNCPQEDLSVTINYHELDENIVKSLSRQRQLAKESSHEKLGSTFNPVQFLESLYCEKELFRAIHFMHYALTALKETNFIITHLTYLNTFNEAILQIFKILMEVISSRSQTKPIQFPSLQTFKEEMQNHAELSKEQQNDLHVYLFSAEILIKNLHHFARLNHMTISEQSC